MTQLLPVQRGLGRREKRCLKGVEPAIAAGALSGCGWERAGANPKGKSVGKKIFRIFPEPKYKKNHVSLGHAGVFDPTTEEMQSPFRLQKMLQAIKPSMLVFLTQLKKGKAPFVYQLFWARAFPFSFLPKRLTYH